MITPIIKNEGRTVIFGPCRLSYTHLMQRYVPQGETGEGKFMTAVLIPKSEKETVKALEKAIEAAKKTGIVSKWDGKEPKNCDTPLRDGDDKENDNDGIYRDCMYMNAKCSTRPAVVDKNRNPIMDEEEVYSGMWAVLSVTFYPYSVSGKKGIACGLNNVMKTKDDERLGGRVSASADFAEVSFDDEDDDDL